MSLYKLWGERWPHFKPFELLSPDGLALFEKGHMVMQPLFMDFLCVFRRELKRSILINYSGLLYRGWRSSSENVRIGGKTYHPQGLAADITVSNMESVDVYVEALAFGFHGVGLYDTFCHVDMRPRLGEQVVTWDFRTDKTLGAPEE